MGERLTVEVMAPRREEAEALLAELRALRLQHNVYRGRVLEVAGGHGETEFAVRELPAVAREDVVLPDGVLERVERQTVGFARHADALLAAGRHLKRGLLMHGPPGTGKTLTIMHLAGRMPDRTVLLVTGGNLYGLGPAIEAARTLVPAMVVLEDVDLVARDRYSDESNAVLFELLNQMDGLQADADVVFVLTTNRAEVLEPALAARPGRIDLAVELPLPDADGRRRLLRLFAAGLDADADGLEELVERLDAVSPAYIREVLRRASLLAAEHGDARRVGREQLLAAADELAETRAQLRRAEGERDAGLEPGLDDDDW
jgi:ATP-dependent 26S proteasome regulatory subunit